MKTKSIIILLLTGTSFTNWDCGKISDLINGKDNSLLYSIPSDKTTVDPFQTVTLNIENNIFMEES